MKWSRVALVAVVVGILGLAVGAALSGWVDDRVDVSISRDPLTPTPVTESASGPIIVQPAVPPEPANALDVSITVNGTPVPVPPASTAPGTPPDHHVSDNFFQFLFWVLLFLGAAGLMLLLFRYLNKSRDDYHETVLALARRGIVAKPTTAVSQPIAQSNGNITFESAIPSGAASSPAFSIKITGSDNAVVGSHERYTATIIGTAPDGTILTWEATRTGQPEPPAVIEPASGDVVFVRPTSPGPFQLKVLANGFDSFTEPLTVAAVAPPSNDTRTIDIPYVGQGYGTLMLAIVIIVALIVLGVEGVLTGEAIAPILGAIAGYIFGVTKPAESK
jgi:hypothetical protein